MNKEPLITVGSIGALVSAVIVLARSFGVPITDDQQNALLGFVAVVSPFVVALVARQFVYSPASVEQIADQQYQAGTPPTQPQPDVPAPAKV